jgi:allantoinase
LKEEGLGVTVETCPHYLFFNDKDIAPGDVRYKCYPPIRCGVNSNILWDCLKMRQIDSIASGHSPASPDIKFVGEKNFRKAISGVVSLGYTLQAIWTRLKINLTRGSRAFEVYITRLFRWMSMAPAKILGIEAKRGSIAVGCYADFVIWNPDEKVRNRPPAKYPSLSIYGDIADMYGHVT